MLLAFVTTLLIAGQAEEPPRVVVVATGRSQTADLMAAEAEALARLAIREQGRLDVVNAAAPSRASAKVIEEARALIAAGEQAYAELETQIATDSLERAVTLLSDELDRTGERELLVRALALLGSVHNQSGKPEEAERAFLTLLALRPTYSFEEGRFPPSDIKLLERLQEELAFTEPGNVKLLSGSVAASVWLDGRLRGTTPLELEGLEPGTHVWLIRREGYLPRSGTLQIAGGGEPVIARARLRAPEHDEELPQRIKAMDIDAAALHPTLGALGAALEQPDELLAIVVDDDPDGPRITLARTLPKEGALVGTREVPAGKGWQERLDVAVRELMDAPAVAIPPPVLASAEAEPEPDGGALWWIAGTAGGVAVVAALAGGTALLLAAGLSRDDGAERTGADEAHELARRRVVLGF